VFRSTSGNEAKMCVHPFDDIVSDSVRKNHRWQDCDVLPKFWHEKMLTIVAYMLKLEEILEHA